jgi:hypothetical protein
MQNPKKFLRRTSKKDKKLQEIYGGGETVKTRLPLWLIELR